VQVAFLDSKLLLAHSTSVGGAARAAKSIELNISVSERKNRQLIHPGYFICSCRYPYKCILFRISPSAETIECTITRVYKLQTLNKKWLHRRLQCVSVSYRESAFEADRRSYRHWRKHGIRSQAGRSGCCQRQSMQIVLK
jgi:hypothetical protein